jgi:hypothetical protein
MGSSTTGTYPVMFLLPYLLPAGSTKLGFTVLRYLTELYTVPTYFYLGTVKFKNSCCTYYLMYVPYLVPVVPGRYTLGRTVRCRRRQDRYGSCTSSAAGTLPRSHTAGSIEPGTVGTSAQPKRDPANVTGRHGRYSRVARRSADRPSRSRSQPVR